MAAEETLTLDDLRKVFKFSSQQAAQELGVNHSRLKRACRVLNVNRWPHRKLSSLNFVKEAMMDNKKTTPEQKMALDAKINREYEHVLEFPAHTLSGEVCSLRHSLWKAKHCTKRKETRCVGGHNTGHRADFSDRGHPDDDEDEDEGELISETDSEERVKEKKSQARKPAKKAGAGRPAGGAGTRAQLQHGGGASPHSHPNSPQHNLVPQSANSLRLDEEDADPSAAANHPHSSLFAVQHTVSMFGTTKQAGAGVMTDGREGMLPSQSRVNPLDCWPQMGTAGRSSSTPRSRLDHPQARAAHSHSQWGPHQHNPPQSGYVHRDWNSSTANLQFSSLGLYSQATNVAGPSDPPGDMRHASMQDPEACATRSLDLACNVRSERHAGQRVDDDALDSPYMYSPKNSLQMHRQHSSQHLYQQPEPQQQSSAIPLARGPALYGMAGNGHSIGSQGDWSAGGFPEHLLHNASDPAVKCEGADGNNLSEQRLGLIEAVLGPAALANTLCTPAPAGGDKRAARRTSHSKQQTRAHVVGGGTSGLQQPEQWPVTTGHEMNSTGSQQLNLASIQQVGITHRRGQHGLYSLNGNGMVGASAAGNVSQQLQPEQQQQQLQQHQQQRYYSLGAGNIQGSQLSSYPYGNSSGQDHFTAPDNNGIGRTDVPSWSNPGSAQALHQMQCQQQQPLAGQMMGPGMHNNSHLNPHQPQTIMQVPRVAVLANGEDDHPSNPMSPFSPKSQRLMHSSLSMPAAFPGYHQAQGELADPLSRASTVPWPPASAAQYDAFSRMSLNGSNNSLAGTPRVTYESSGGYNDAPTLRRVNSWDLIPTDALDAQVNSSPTLLERGMSGMLSGMDDEPLANMGRGLRRITARDVNVNSSSGDLRNLFDTYECGNDLIATATAAIGNALPPLRTHCTTSPFATQRGLYPIAHLNLPGGQTSHMLQYLTQAEDPAQAPAAYATSPATTPRLPGLVLDLSTPSQNSDVLTRVNSWRRCSAPNADVFSQGSGACGVSMQHANSPRMSRGLDPNSLQTNNLTERMSMLTHTTGDLMADTPETLEALAEFQFDRQYAYAHCLTRQFKAAAAYSTVPAAASPSGSDQNDAEQQFLAAGSANLPLPGIMLHAYSGDEIADAAGRPYNDNLYGTGDCCVYPKDSDGFDISSREGTPRVGMCNTFFAPSPTPSTVNQLLAHNHRQAAGKESKGLRAPDSPSRSANAVSDRKHVQTVLVPNTLVLPVQHASSGLGYAIPAAATPLLANSSRFRPGPVLALATSTSLPFGQTSTLMQAAAVLNASPQRSGPGQRSPSSVVEGGTVDRSSSLEDASMLLARSASDPMHLDTISAENSARTSSGQQRVSSEGVSSGSTGQEDVAGRGRRASGKTHKPATACTTKPAAAAGDQNTIHPGDDNRCWVATSSSAGRGAPSSAHPLPSQARTPAVYAAHVELRSHDSIISHGGEAALYKPRSDGGDTARGVDSATPDQTLEVASECSDLELTQPAGVFRNLAAIRVHPSGRVDQTEAGAQSAGRQASFPWTDAGLDSSPQGQSPGSPSLRACKDADVGFGSGSGSPKRAQAEQGLKPLNSPTKKGRTTVQGLGSSGSAPLMMTAGSKAPQAMSRMRSGTADHARDTVVE